MNTITKAITNFKEGVYIRRGLFYIIILYTVFLVLLILRIYIIAFTLFIYIRHFYTSIIYDYNYIYYIIFTI